MTVDLTPVQQLQTEMGVEFYEWDGWPWPSNFGNPVEEYLAVRNGVGIVENSGLRKWELRGPDALRAADHIVAQDCSDMPVGRVHYTPVCNHDGMALDDITVFHLAPDRVMLVSGLLSSEAHFRSAATEFDVELVPVSDERGGVQIQGPRSRDVLGRATDFDLAGLPYFHCAETEVAGEECILSRTGYSGELGYEVFASPADVATIWNALLEAGEQDGIRPYGLEAADYLRVESGLIFVTFDYQPGELTPYELGLGWAVKLDKGDFIGKEALRGLADQKPRRFITGIVFEGDQVPEPESAVEHEGEAVGTVTVAVRSAVLDRVAALAVLDGRLSGSEGASVRVGDLEGEVASLPLYDPERTRPRA
ncbi:MAG TPA: aminomethyltransferase family protein [Gaiellaceae bacterium]|jgi:aminomethyltransferase